MSQSKWFNPSNVARAALTVLLAAGIALTFHYYFYKAVPVEKAKPVYQKISDFYANFPLADRDISADNIRQMTSGNGQLPGLQAMAIESAFIRYRLDPSVGGLFDKYIFTIRDGRWNVPQLSVWRAEFDKIAGPWDGRHAEHLQSGLDRPTPKNNLSKSNITLEFTTATTAMIGRSLVLDLELPAAEMTSEMLEFSVTYEDEVRPYIHGCNWKPKVSRIGNKWKAQLSLDFSTMMSWCRSPDRRVKRIVITGGDFTDAIITGATCH